MIEPVHLIRRHDVELVIEALAMAAARHESSGHVTVGRFRARHDDQAAAMRALRHRLVEQLRRADQAHGKRATI